MKPIKLKDLKAGQLFYETDMGQVLHCRADFDARETEDGKGYSCLVTVCHIGQMPRSQRFYEAKECGHYGLKLFTE